LFPIEIAVVEVRRSRHYVPLAGRNITTRQTPAPSGLMED
jgi:hypothetical protein